MLQQAALRDYDLTWECEIEKSKTSKPQTQIHGPQINVSSKPSLNLHNILFTYTFINPLRSHSLPSPQPPTDIYPHYNLNIKPLPLHE